MSSTRQSSGARASGWQRSGWMAVGAAACWMLLMAWGAVDRSGNNSRSDSSSQPVVLAWTQYAGQPNDSADETVSDTDDDRFTRPSEAASDAEPDLAAPDWLISAINLADESDAGPVDVESPDVAAPETPPTDKLESTNKPASTEEL